MGTAALRMNTAFIPVYKPSLSELERQYLLDCFDSGWISSQGKYIDRFEQLFGQITGCPHSLTTSNGTVALHLALMALGLKEGDEVIVPTLTYVASVNAIAYVGATPVFVDSASDTWQLDPLAVESKVGPRTRAILAVHLYGHPADLSYLTNIARRYNLYLVEDCAEAFGSSYQGIHVGNYGDISTFSFFGNKTITTGEGGMVATQSAALAAEVRQLKSQYMSSERRYWHEKVGYNYRLTNLQAAIGVAQLERADSILTHKATIASWYRSLLPCEQFSMHSPNGDVVHSFWMISVTLPESVSRDRVAQWLAKQGIETRPVFYPVHTMPMHMNWPSSRHNYPVADHLSRNSLNLPSWPGLTFEDVERVCTALKEALTHSKK